MRDTIILMIYKGNKDMNPILRKEFDIFFDYGQCTYKCYLRINEFIVRAGRIGHL